MNKYFYIVPFIVFVLTIIVFFYLLLIERDPSELPSALIHEKVPIFETSTLFNGKTFVSSEEFGKKVTIVNFFATWCVPCREEHKYIKRLSKEKGIKIIGVNFKDDLEIARQWLNELGNPYSIIAVDSTGSIGMEWGVYGLPETFIVNKDKIIEYRHAGPITKKVYDDFYLKIIEIKK